MSGAKMNTTIHLSEEQAKVANASEADDVLVVAGAGSGKTTTMTERVNHLIASGVPSERILGLTFTKKAAAELSSRVSSGAANGTSMLLKPTVMTYDAFFQSIVRQYGLLIGFDQDTQPLSDAGAFQLASNVVDAHLDQLFAAVGQTDGDNGSESAADSADNDTPDGTQQGAFTTLVGRLLNLSHAISGAMIGGDCDSFAEAVRRVRHWDDAFIDRLQHIIDADTAERGVQVPAGDPLAKSVPKPPKQLKKDSDETYGNKVREYQEKLRNLRADSALFHCAQLRDVTRQRNVLLDLVEAYEQAKRESGMAEFSDFTIAAYQLVRRFPSIGQQYRNRYTHVLLDEYQDTSTTQAELIAALFHPEAHATAPGATADRSAVTAVGDPYQSIYAWRGASPGALRIFQRAFGLEQPGYQPFPMTISRRNPRAVLRMANNLTMRLRRPHRRPSSSRMTEVEVLPLNPAPDRDELGTIGIQEYETLGQEIDGVVRFAQLAIARHASADPATEAKRRPHVAILFRSKQRMDKYAQALRSAGLSVQMVGYSALLERADVRDILALLHVVSDPTDSQSLMRLLATPRFHMEASDLTALSALANRRDTDRRYQALVQAGYATGEEGMRDRAAMVREYREQLPHLVYLSDVVDQAQTADDLAGSGMSDRAVDAVLHAGRILREVRKAMDLPLDHVVRAAARALDLDIDTVLAQAFAFPDVPVNPSLAHAPVESIIELVGTYTQEITQGKQVTLRGFITWVDSLKKVDDPTAAIATEPVDVILMTIHQAKGLQWDAVAVVDVNETTFPSNQGDYLSVKRANDSQDTTDSPSDTSPWQPPEYTEQANTWLTSADMVPAPVRADADILPRFPHDATVGGDPVEALDAFDDTLTVADEVFGTGRDLPLDDMDTIDKNKLFLTQREEYGRRLHEDERRLAYVAVTRAKHDVLVTAAKYSTTDMIASSGKVTPGSVFWQEMYDSMSHDARTGALGAVLDVVALPSWADSQELEADPDTDADDGQPHTLESVGQNLPKGFFIGDDARMFEDTVVGQAWRTPQELTHADGHLPWPGMLSEQTRRNLDQSAQHALDWICAERGKSMKPQEFEDTGVLTRSTRALLDDIDLQPQEYQLNIDQRDLDKQVEQTAQRLMANTRRSVTSLQAQSGETDRRKLQEFWRGMIRPIPHVASPTAEAGTVFHAWAERFINAFNDAAITDDATDTTASGAMVSREAMIQELQDRERQYADASQPVTAVDKRLAVWERRLVVSRWAERRPQAAERQIVVAVPQLDHIIVHGKLDAVFYGGLDPHDDTKRFTIVDWKTGRKPSKQSDIDEKLAQLDMYRLLLSRVENVPLDSIDATLYYLSEATEADRELHARGKTEQDILAELSSGIPEESDND